MQKIRLGQFGRFEAQIEHAQFETNKRQVSATDEQTLQRRHRRFKIFQFNGFAGKGKIELNIIGGSQDLAENGIQSGRTGPTNQSLRMINGHARACDQQKRTNKLE